MAPGKSRVIGPADLERAVRGVAGLFDAEDVVIIGSQALLVGRDDIDRQLRMSVEIDAYPGNIRAWEELHPEQEASEVINAWLGEGSSFHTAHGFFVDGVDERTASLSEDWRDRAVSRTVASDGRSIKVIAPEPNDLVASKLARGDHKDVVFARICLRSGLVKHDIVKRRLEVVMPDRMLAHALSKLSLASRGSKNPGVDEGRNEIS